MLVSKKWTTLLVALPLAVGALACGRGDERAALTEDELNRELDLALKGDSTGVTLEDTAVAALPAPEPEPAPRQPTTRPPNRAPAPRPRPAEPEPAPTGPRTVTSTVPVGSTFAITLNETLSTATNVAGDAFTGTLQEPILDANGDVLIPSGATVRGRVTRVDKSDRVGETGVLNLAFEAILHDGESYPLDASVIEANPERRTRQTTGQQAGKVAAGAAAGAIIGRVLGKDTKGAIKGAVVGAAAGTAIAMGTADVDVVLPAGSTMRVRTDTPITIRRVVSD